MEIPLYYGWPKYKELLKEYFLANAEKEPVRYQEVSKNVDIGDNYVSSMSKWLAVTGFLLTKQRGTYQLSDLGLNIARAINHDLDYKPDLNTILLTSKNLGSLFAFLEKVREIDFNSLMNRIVLLSGIKQIQTYHKAGVNCLIDALCDADILKEEDGVLKYQQHSKTPIQQTSDTSLSVKDEKIAQLQNIFLSQGKSLHYETEIDDVFLIMIEEENSDLKPALSIEVPELRGRIVLNTDKQLLKLRSLVQDERLDLLLQYIRLASLEGIVNDDRFTL